MEIMIRTAAAGDAEALLNIYAWYVRHTAITLKKDWEGVSHFNPRLP